MKIRLHLTLRSLGYKIKQKSEFVKNSFLFTFTFTCFQKSLNFENFTWFSSLATPENWVIKAVRPKAAFHVSTILKKRKSDSSQIGRYKKINFFSSFLDLKRVCCWAICFICSAGTVWYKVAHKLGSQTSPILSFIIKINWLLFFFTTFSNYQLSFRYKVADKLKAPFIAHPFVYNLKKKQSLC